MAQRAALAMGRAGHTFNIGINSVLGAGTRAIIGNTSDADARITLLRGADVVGGGAQRTADDGFLLPSLDGVTSDRAPAKLPPPPTKLPEPSSLLMFAIGPAGLARVQKPPFLRMIGLEGLPTGCRPGRCTLNPCWMTHVAQEGVRGDLQRCVLMRCLCRACARI